MSHVTEQAEELRKRAIDILLTERAAIDERLALLSYGGAEASLATPGKRKACSICGSADHNVRRCPKSNSTAMSSEMIPVEQA